MSEGLSEAVSLGEVGREVRLHDRKVCRLWTVHMLGSAPNEAQRWLSLVSCIREGEDILRTTQRQSAERHIPDLF